jgi:hypothetical protein
MTERGTDIGRCNCYRLRTSRPIDPRRAEMRNLARKGAAVPFRGFERRPSIPGGTRTS